MHALRVLIKSLTVLLLAAACARSNGGPAVADPLANAPASGQSPDQLSVPNEVANAISAQTSLVCKGACPPALAMSIASLRQESKTLLYRCTAFLVSPDVIATNAHCVPADLHTVNASCAGRMSFYFGSPSETVSCDRVVSISEDSKSNLQPDYAFLRLGRTVQRQPLQPSRKGAADNEAFTVYSVDPAVVNGQHVGVLNSRTCAAVQRSLLTPQFTNDFADVFTTVCSMNLGNSGSPVIAQDGTVRGLLHGIRTTPTTAYKGYKMPAAFDQLAFATNFSCAVSPVLEGTPPSVCDAPVPSRSQVVGDLMATTQGDLDKPFAAWLASSAPRIFKFALERIDSNQRKASIAHFTCIENPETWLKKSAADLGLESLNVTGSQVTLGLTIPLWGLQPVLDSTERVSVAVDVIDRAKTKLVFNLDDAKKNRFAHVTKSFTSESGLLVARTATLDIPFCN